MIACGLRISCGVSVIRVLCWCTSDADFWVACLLVGFSLAFVWVLFGWFWFWVVVLRF